MADIDERLAYEAPQPPVLIGAVDDSRGNPTYTPAGLDGPSTYNSGA